MKSSIQQRTGKNAFHRGEPVRPRIPARVSEPLVANTESLQNAFIALRTIVFEVRQKPAPFSDHD